MTTIMWTRVDYVPECERYAVEVYRDGVWLRTLFFHSEDEANSYAAEVRRGEETCTTTIMKHKVAYI